MKAEEFGGPHHAEPVLAVQDVEKAVLYWHTTLGFPEKWTWGEPPVHGGVSWKGTSVQFSRNEKLAEVSKGNTVFISVRNLEGLYRFHQERKAEIIEPLENKPWGMAGYTIKDINGYFIVFAGALLSNKEKSITGLPASIRIVSRKPSTEEYKQLTSSVGWSLFTTDEVIEKLLAAPVFAVVAEDTGSNEAIGCALLLSDGASFYYVKDVVVHPSRQSQQVGSGMMKELNNWLQAHAADNALVALITPESIAPFYRQFDFGPAFSMIKFIDRKP